MATNDESYAASVASTNSDGDGNSDAYNFSDNDIVGIRLSESIAAQSSNNHDLEDEDENYDEEVVKGVVFGRNVRSFVCYLYVAVFDDDDNDDECYAFPRSFKHNQVSDSDRYDHISVMIRFDTQDFELVKSFRSHFRRFCRLGDLLSLKGAWSSARKSLENHNRNDDDDNNIIDISSSNPSSSSCIKTCMFNNLVINVQSIHQSHNVIRVIQPRVWSMTIVQSWQQRLRFYQHKEQQRDKPNGDTISTSASGTTNTNRDGHGVVDKGIQATMVANFLIHMFMNECDGNSDSMSKNYDTSTWTDLPSALSESHDDWDERYIEAVRKLNEGSGVLDVAGGSGHLSMALGLRGIKSTVVDPRENVGKLPCRARKIWRRALNQHSKMTTQVTPTSTSHRRAATDDEINSEPQLSMNKQLYCQPVKYDAHRAWFGQKPSGVEEDFRNTDNSKDVPILDETDELLRNCSCIVALHPDEATDFIFDRAISLRKKFVVVPCCVFARLFPNRRIQQSNKPVSTYDDLLEFHREKDPSIKSARLPFDGKNIVLWSSMKTIDTVE